MKIELTKEQIEQIAANEAAELRKAFESDKLKLEARLKADVAKLEKTLESDISKLNNKYKFFDFDLEKPKKERASRVAFDADQLKALVAENKPVKEIADLLNKSESQVRSKLFALGIKLRKK